MNKVEFKKNFEIGYQEIEFLANNDETTILIESKYSVPTSTVTSYIINIKGTLFEEKRWGLLFSNLIVIRTDINANVYVKLESFKIDTEEFDEESFIQHLIDEVTDKIMDTNLQTVLKKMKVV